MNYKKQTIIVNIPNRKQKKMIKYNLISELIKENKRVIFFCDDKRKGLRFKYGYEEFERDLNGYSSKSILINSDLDELPYVQKLKSEGQLDDEIKLIISTSYISSGINIKMFDKKFAYIFDYTEISSHSVYETIIQMINRVRLPSERDGIVPNITQIFCLCNILKQEEESYVVDAEKLHTRDCNITYKEASWKIFHSSDRKINLDNKTGDINSEDYTKASSILRILNNPKQNPEDRTLSTLIKAISSPENSLIFKHSDDLFENIELFEKPEKNIENEFTINALKAIIKEIGSYPYDDVKVINKWKADMMGHKVISQLKIENHIIKSEKDGKKKLILKCFFHPSFMGVFKKLLYNYRVINTVYYEEGLKEVINFFFTKSKIKNYSSAFQRFTEIYRIKSGSLKIFYDELQFQIYKNPSYCKEFIIYMAVMNLCNATFALLSVSKSKLEITRKLFEEFYRLRLEYVFNKCFRSKTIISGSFHVGLKMVSNMNLKNKFTLVKKEKTRDFNKETKNEIMINEIFEWDKNLVFLDVFNELEEKDKQEKECFEKNKTFFDRLNDDTMQRFRGLFYNKNDKDKAVGYIYDFSMYEIINENTYQNLNQNTSQSKIEIVTKNLFKKQNQIQKEIIDETWVLKNYKSKITNNFRPKGRCTKIHLLISLEGDTIYVNTSKKEIWEDLVKEDKTSSLMCSVDKNLDFKKESNFIKNSKHIDNFFYLKIDAKLIA